MHNRSWLGRISQLAMDGNAGKDGDRIFIQSLHNRFEWYTEK